MHFLVTLAMVSRLSTLFIEGRTIKGHNLQQRNQKESLFQDKNLEKTVCKMKWVKKCNYRWQKITEVEENIQDKKSEVQDIAIERRNPSNDN